MSAASSVRFLNRLARLHGIQTAYYDVNDRRRQASTESLMAMLQSLGVPIAHPGDVMSAWREHRYMLWRRLIEPVNVVRGNEPPLIKIRIPSTSTESSLEYNLKMENGQEYSGMWQIADVPATGTAEVEGEKYAVKYLSLNEELLPGYHRLNLELPGRNEESLIISAPAKAYSPSADVMDRYWGVFLPLYALQMHRSWGSGDFSDLEELTGWVADMGGRVVATLPLLAIFTDRENEISPYLPISRLMWNEFYLNIDGIPELKKCSPLQEILSSPSLRNEIDTLRNSSLVDYRRQMGIKRTVLEEMSRRFFINESQGLEDLRLFTAANPAVNDYSRFRAACEKLNSRWHSWPERLKNGDLRETDYDEKTMRYHLFVQWLAKQQIEKLSRKAEGKGVQLYLDLPLAVHPEGYDTWHERDAFIPGTSAGAPPDTVFTKGQDWYSTPLHPEKIREQGYRYVIAYLRHHLRHAGILRIDHVMGLHRLFCIPDGMEAGQGVYLRYRADELYAILSLESQRYRTIIVGEDLGTVPPYVRPAMNRHNLYRMYVMHYELISNKQEGLSSVPRNSVASLNTHDMHPFAALWQGLDIDHRRELGLLDEKGARKERKVRKVVINILSSLLRQKGWLKSKSEDTTSALQACLSFLADSRARVVLVNLEDLWLEKKPQNVPSTGKEYPNWRRKAQYTFEQFSQMPQVVSKLQDINEIRKQGRRC